MDILFSSRMKAFSDVDVLEGHLAEVGGAQRLHVLRLVFGQGLVLLAIGTVIGLGGAFVLTRWLQSLLFEITPTDPLTYSGVVVLLAAVALLACYIPARRATKVDPLVALRYE